MWEPDDAPASPPDFAPVPACRSSFHRRSEGQPWDGARGQERGMVPPAQRAGAAGRALPCATPVLLPLSPALPTSAPCPSPWKREGCFRLFGQQRVSLCVLSRMSQARRVPWHSLLMSQPQDDGTVGAARLGMTRKLRGLNVCGVPVGRKQGSHIPGLHGTARCCSPARSLVPAWTELLSWPAASQSVWPGSLHAIWGDGSSSMSAPCRSVLLFFFSLTQARPQEPNYF